MKNDVKISFTQNWLDDSDAESSEAIGSSREKIESRQAKESIDILALTLQVIPRTMNHLTHWMLLMQSCFKIKMWKIQKWPCRDLDFSVQRPWLQVSPESKDFSYFTKVLTILWADACKLFKHFGQLVTSGYSIAQKF